MENKYINIKEIAQAKGLKSTRSIRMEINKPESKYVSKEVKVNGGTSYEILFSSLEPELQQKLRDNETKSTALVPLNYQAPVVTDKARLTANHRMNIVKAALEHRAKYQTQNQADHEFLELYNTGLFLPKAYEFLGSISIGTLRRYIQAYLKNGSAECLIPQYKITKQGEYNSILDEKMKKVLLSLLLHQNRFAFNTAIRLAKQILIKQGYDEESLPSNITFKRFAEHFRDNNYAEWTLKREGIKAYHDKVEPYIERDISKIEVGDVLIADGHVLNFQVINPFTGKPTRATLVGFLDWKSTALVGYEHDSSRIQIAYAGGLTKPMLTDIRNTDVAKVQYYFDKHNINTDFDGEKFLAWATTRVFNILKCINEHFKLNIGFPKHILVKPPSKLNLENMENTYGFTNFVPSRIHKDSDEITPALSIIFNKDFPWEKINEISDIDYYITHNSNTDFFLESIFHEFSHIIHENHLLNKFGTKQTIRKLFNLTDQGYINRYRRQFGE